MKKSEQSVKCHNDLYLAFKAKYASTPGVHTVDYILGKVLNSQAPQFYVSSEEALENYYLIESKKQLTVKSDLHKDKYAEIHRITTSIIANGDKRSVREIIEQVIEQPAPRFYLLPSSAKTIISNYLNQKIKNRRQNGK